MCESAIPLPATLSCTNSFSTSEASGVCAMNAFRQLRQSPLVPKPQTADRKRLTFRVQPFLRISALSGRYACGGVRRNVARDVRFTTQTAPASAGRYQGMQPSEAERPWPEA